MPGNVIGGKHAAATTKKLYGDDFFKKAGYLGGSRKVKKGFAMMDRAHFIKISAAGGRKSRRGKAKPYAPMA